MVAVGLRRKGAKVIAGFYCDNRLGATEGLYIIERQPTFLPAVLHHHSSLLDRDIDSHRSNLRAIGFNVVDACWQ